MTKQPEALRLADEFDWWVGGLNLEPRLADAAEELRRLHLHELALQDWLDKTDWVQETAQAGELGMHRADVLKKRIEKLEAINQELLEALDFYGRYILRSKAGDASILTPIDHDCGDRARAAIAKAERTTT